MSKIAIVESEFRICPLLERALILIFCEKFRSLHMLFNYKTTTKIKTCTDLIQNAFRNGAIPENLISES